MQVSQTASALQALQRANQQTPSAKKPVTLDAEQEKKQQAKQTRFDVDEQSLVLVEQNQQSSHQSGTFQGKYADYDQPSRHNQSAVLAYQSIGNINQREHIEKMFGVDLLA